MTSQPTLQQVTDSIRSHDYMSGVDRDKDRVGSTEEVFTDTNKARDLVERMHRHRPEMFTDTLRGLDLMQDNVELCRRRLLCGHEEMRAWADQYIIQGDCFENDYTFGEAPTIGHPAQHHLWE